MKKSNDKKEKAESTERRKAATALPFWKMQTSMIVGHYLAFSSPRTSTNVNNS